MSQDAEQLSVEFNNSATKLFFSLQNQFAKAVKNLDRRRDENVFQQLLGKYAYTLKLQLEDMAQTLIAKNQGLENITLLKKKMTDTISSFTNEFIHKSKLL